jgi:PAS domain S-box-containing protein
MPGVSAEPRLRTPVKILIVEDSPEDRATMRIYLSEAGAAEGIRFEFVECGMGEAGLAACRADKPDCLLLDYGLPDMDAIEFLARLKADWGLVPVAVLVLTGSADRSLASHAYRADAQAYLPKRLIGPELMMQAVLAALDRFRLQTERQQIERALVDSEQRFRQIMEAAPSAMIITGLEGRIEMVNRETERMFGYGRAELLGQPIEMLLPTRLRGQKQLPSSADAEDPRARRTSPAQELFGLRRDGSEFQVHIGLNPIQMEAGHTEAGGKVVSSIVDISGRVLLEAKFRQAQKMEAVGRLTAGVAHDFNNLLQALMSGLELLLDEVRDRPLALQYGQVAFDAAERGGKLTHRLLAFSRQEMLVPRLVPLRPLLSNVEALLSHTFPANISLCIEPVPERWAVFADAAQLEAAVINLAVNARDAMAPSGGQLRISAFQSETPVIPGLPARRYTVVVADDEGHGMDTATLAQACEPFFTTKGLGGSGLGLSMVQGFARQSGGDVHITSAVGRGTRIEIWLPADDAVLPDGGRKPEGREPGEPDAAGPAISAPAVRKRRILLADDSQDTLVTVGAFLQTAGFDVTKFTDGTEALASLASGIRYDAVVADYAMPGLNGMDLLAQSRELVPNLPGLLITAYSDTNLRREIADVAILRKPFTRTDLTTAIHHLLSAETKPVP